MRGLKGFRSRIVVAQRETFALYSASRDSRIPWYARMFGAAIVAYAVSPIDLIPDFIPIIGLLDDLVIIPLGVVLMRRMIAPAILEEHRQAAVTRIERGGRSGWLAAAVVAAIWLALAALFVLIFIV